MLNPGLEVNFATSTIFTANCCPVSLLMHRRTTLKGPLQHREKPAINNHSPPHSAATPLLPNKVPTPAFKCSVCTEYTSRPCCSLNEKLIVPTVDWCQEHHVNSVFSYIKDTFSYPAPFRKAAHLETLCNM